jgi:hypothetical protein
MTIWNRDSWRQESRKGVPRNPGVGVFQKNPILFI